MKRRAKNISDRIRDECKYTEELNAKINKLEAKVRNKKENSKVKKLNFEYVKQFKYLKEQQ